MEAGNFIIGVVSGDSRGIVSSTEIFPFSSVATVDSQFDNNPRSNLIGSGSFITPNHVLTAGHVVFDPRRNNPIPSGARVTPSTTQGNLNSRILGNESDPGANVNPDGINYLLDFDQVSGSVRGLIPFDRDIALLSSNINSLEPENSIGIITFVDPFSAKGLNIRTAGFPADGRTIGDNTDMTRLNGRTLVESPKPGLGLDPNNSDVGRIQEVGDVTRNPSNPDELIDLERIIYFSFDIDVESGQSGGPVWHTLAGDSQPRMLGLITGALTGNPINLGLDFGTVGILITTDVYDSIMVQLEQDGWAGIGNVLPENAIVGSENDDFIVGSFRRERIVGAGGENLLFGGGGDDRLEGSLGIDLALFAEPVENYTILEDIENGGFIVEHTGGSQTEGRNLLTNIELAVFGYDISSSTENQDSLYFLPLNLEVNQDILDNLSLRFPSIETIENFILSSDIYQPPLADDLFHSPHFGNENGNSLGGEVRNGIFANLFMNGVNPLPPSQSFPQDNERSNFIGADDNNFDSLPQDIITPPSNNFVPHNSIFDSAFVRI